jgi:hypothetical protein
VNSQTDVYFGIVYIDETTANFIRMFLHLIMAIQVEADDYISEVENKFRVKTLILRI